MNRLSLQSKLIEPCNCDSGSVQWSEHIVIIYYISSVQQYNIICIEQPRNLVRIRSNSSTLPELQRVWPIRCVWEWDFTLTARDSFHSEDIADFADTGDNGISLASVPLLSLRGVWRWSECPKLVWTAIYCWRFCCDKARGLFSPASAISCLEHRILPLSSGQNSKIWLHQAANTASLWRLPTLITGAGRNCGVPISIYIYTSPQCVSESTHHHIRP